MEIRCVLTERNDPIGLIIRICADPSTTWRWPPLQNLEAWVSKVWLDVADVCTLLTRYSNYTGETPPEDYGGEVKRLKQVITTLEDQISEKNKTLAQVRISFQN